MATKTARRPQRSKRERDIVRANPYGQDVDTLIRKIRGE